MIHITAAELDRLPGGLLPDGKRAWKIAEEGRFRLLGRITGCSIGVWSAKSRAGIDSSLRFPALICEGVAFILPILPSTLSGK